jgi:hypothetical protein
LKLLLRTMPTSVRRMLPRKFSVFSISAMARENTLLGSVSNVDIDGNNTLQIRAIGVVTSTFETLPARV